MPSTPHEIHYAAEAVADLRGLRKFDQQRILDGIELHRTHTPRFVSKSRIKAMSQPFWSQYRLRIEDVRVYYDVDDKTPSVNVLRILVKATDQAPEESP